MRSEPSFVRCVGCKQDLPASEFAADRHRPTGRRYKCRPCSSAEFQRWKATPGYQRRLEVQKAQRHQLKRENPQVRWAQMAINNCRRRAKAAGMEFSLTVEWLLANAPEVCPALGERLDYGARRSHSFAAAVDRIDNDGGYTPDNCWVISMLANRIKSNASHEQILAVGAALQAVVTLRGLAPQPLQPVSA